MHRSPVPLKSKATTSRACVSPIIMNCSSIFKHHFANSGKILYEQAVYIAFTAIGNKSRVFCATKHRSWACMKTLNSLLVQNFDNQQNLKILNFYFVIISIFVVICWHFSKSTFSKKNFMNTIRVSNSLNPDQDQHFFGPDLDPNCL